MVEQVDGCHNGTGGQPLERRMWIGISGTLGPMLLLALALGATIHGIRTVYQQQTRPHIESIREADHAILLTNDPSSY